MSKELSIFIDESGDFGPPEPHSPYYIITMVFHDQHNDINSYISKLDDNLTNLNLPSTYVHTGPIIRKEREYYHYAIDLRRKILSRMLQFTRNIKIKYQYFCIEKHHVVDSIDLIGRLSVQISQFIKDNLDYFCSFDSVKVYYDKGQTEVTKILSSVFNSLISGVEFRLVSPSEYKLFQVADFYCTFELINLKAQKNCLSNSEKLFFRSNRNLRKNYIKLIRKNLFS